jgi:D-ribose pyranase
MKNNNLLNAEILSTIALLGHQDSITIADCGLPIADTTKRIDISLRKGVPAFLETLDVCLSEFQPERAIIAEEIKKASPECHRAILERLENVDIDYISHEEFKKVSGRSKACIRTGECTPYANIILISGSIF